MIRKIDLRLVKQLRQKTGVSVMACREALIEAHGNLKKAEEILRKQGKEFAQKKVERETHQGLIDAYIHTNGKIGALIEVHCETDFVAKTKEFKTLCHELALQVAGYNPSYISPEYIPREDLEKQKKVIEQEFKLRGLTGQRLKKATESKLEKFKKENSLLKQPYFRNEQITVEDLINQAIAKLGENIRVKRFVRYEI